VKVRYVGGYVEALINGVIVKHGEVIDLPAKVAKELIARGECEAVVAKPKKGAGK
jgi:hypothetical protein